MRRQAWSAALVVGLIASALSISPGRAQTQIPPVVQVEDPVGDSNFLNDQDNAYGTPLEGEGDHTTPMDVGNASDFMKVWFTHTVDTISLHFQSQLPPPASQDLYYRFATNPGTGSEGADETRGCIFWILIMNGSQAGGNAGAWIGPDTAIVDDSCNATDPAEATFTVEPGPDGTGITTISAPRSYSPLFVDNSVITQVYGVARFLVIGPGLPSQVAASGFATAATADTTKRGTDYTITPITPPGFGNPPGKGKKKGCPKGKGKKKGACPSPSPSPSPT